jgi:hypothetical protein
MNAERRGKEPKMGAEWNKVIDNTGIRIALIVTGLGLWTVAAVGLLTIA